MEEKSTGTVKWFDPSRGYGFIARDDGGSDVFVHQSAILGMAFPSLYEGDKVRFEVESAPKGPRAANVERV